MLVACTCCCWKVPSLLSVRTCCPLSSCGQRGVLHRPGRQRTGDSECWRGTTDAGNNISTPFCLPSPPDTTVSAHPFRCLQLIQQFVEHQLHLLVSLLPARPEFQSQVLRQLCVRFVSAGSPWNLFQILVSRFSLVSATYSGLRIITFVNRQNLQGRAWIWCLAWHSGVTCLKPGAWDRLTYTQQ